MGNVESGGSRSSGAWDQPQSIDSGLCDQWLNASLSSLFDSDHLLAEFRDEAQARKNTGDLGGDDAALVRCAA